MLPAFSCISWACVFAGDGAAIFFSGLIGLPVGGLKKGFLAQWAGSFGISWCILSLVKKPLHCRRAGFEPQRIVVHEEGESPTNTRRSRPSQNDDPSLCATRYTFGGVGELHRRRLPFNGIASLCKPPPHQDRGRARAAGNRLARDGKVPGPQLGAKHLTRRTAS